MLFRSRILTSSPSGRTSVSPLPLIFALASSITLMNEPADWTMSAEEKIEIHRGLKGVYFERSATTFIDGKAGELRYRGYSIHDLATSSTFEETAYLLLHGELPTAAELQAFDAQLKAARQLPDPVL